jgi:hypothetical protein
MSVRADRTVVIVAHHDAAHNGWVWHDRVVERSRRRAAKTGIGGGRAA